MVLDGLYSKEVDALLAESLEFWARDGVQPLGLEHPPPSDSVFPAKDQTRELKFLLL